VDIRSGQRYLLESPRAAYHCSLCPGETRRSQNCTVCARGQRSDHVFLAVDGIEDAEEGRRQIRSLSEVHQRAAVSSDEGGEERKDDVQYLTRRVNDLGAEANKDRRNLVAITSSSPTERVPGTRNEISRSRFPCEVRITQLFDYFEGAGSSCQRCKAAQQEKKEHRA
jgi:hypothetical protein